jgi:hypothetical protein
MWARNLWLSSSSFCFRIMQRIIALWSSKQGLILARTESKARHRKTEVDIKQDHGISILYIDMIQLLCIFPWCLLIAWLIYPHFSASLCELSQTFGIPLFQLPWLCIINSFISASFGHYLIILIFLSIFQANLPRMKIWSSSP